MTRYVVVLQTREGLYGGREGLRVVDAETPADAVRTAHPYPPDIRVVRAWVHPLEGLATLVDVEVEQPRWGRAREGASS